MTKIKRKANRKQSGLPVDLLLYNSTDDSILSGPIAAFLHNISYHGAGLILPEIFFRPHHLFYSPNDNEKHVLCLEKRDQSEDNIIIPIKPIWFRLGTKEAKGYFKMGVEFMTLAEDKDVIDLEKMALKSFAVHETLLTKLVRIFS
jgi:hypothetical protein